MTKLYWAFIVPLAATFDWMRTMFEKGKAIREAKKAEILAKVREQAREEERERIKTALDALDRNGVTLTPEVVATVFNDSGDDR